MASRYRIGKVEEFDEGTRIIREINGLEIAVFRVEGEYFAIANYCVHQGGPLCQGDLTGRVAVGADGWEWEYEDVEKYVLCPWHGWMFDVTTGVCVDAPRYVTPTYEVVVDDGVVYVVR